MTIGEYIYRQGHTIVIKAGKTSSLLPRISGVGRKIRETEESKVGLDVDVHAITNETAHALVQVIGHETTG